MRSSPFASRLAISATGLVTLAFAPQAFAAANFSCDDALGGSAFFSCDDTFSECDLALKENGQPFFQTRARVVLTPNRSGVGYSAVVGDYELEMPISQRSLAQKVRSGKKFKLGLSALEALSGRSSPFRFECKREK